MFLKEILKFFSVGLSKEDLIEFLIIFEKRIIKVLLLWRY